MAKLIQVIEADELRGKGVVGNPYRTVVVYYATDGTRLAERDPETEGLKHAWHTGPITGEEIDRLRRPQ